MKNLHVRITFEEDILGTANANPEIHREYIAGKAPNAPSKEEEIAAIGVDAAEEKSTTVFPRDEDGAPILWNYQIKGFFKEACGMLQRMKGEKCAKESIGLKAYKKTIDGDIEPSGDGQFCRKIRLIAPGEVDVFQRPLRAQTAQGERIALASSERLPKGTTAEFWVRYPDILSAVIKEWLDYGRYHGLGQWRNAGYGRFSYEVLETVDC